MITDGRRSIIENFLLVEGGKTEPGGFIMYHLGHDYEMNIPYLKHLVKSYISHYSVTHALVVVLLKRTLARYFSQSLKHFYSLFMIIPRKLKVESITLANVSLSSIIST